MTRGAKSGLFDVATVLGKILLVGTAVFQTNNPMMMAVCFNVVVYAEIIITLIAKPFRDTGSNLIVLVVRMVTGWTTFCSLLVAYVNDPEVGWPAIVWYCGAIPSMLFAYKMGRIVWHVTDEEMEKMTGIDFDGDGEVELDEEETFEDEDDDGGGAKFSELEQQAVASAEVSAVFNKLLACGDQDESHSMNLDAQANLSQLQLAASNQAGGLAQLLNHPQFQLQVTKKDAFGNLPLHYSAQAGFPAGLELLLETNEDDRSGADLTGERVRGVK